ncbi:cell envelope integrity protein TolA [Novosphingobium sp. FKTRR1]|uniref:cell envelope integrity protein TolA n=1 Tax=Novosphingobium sp. FKTRR1 TaxID=2879118 RepID=UPI001CF00C93|nr:hypothetical protein [Novosphingobium sp. FKTRR1]
MYDPAIHGTFDNDNISDEDRAKDAALVEFERLQGATAGFIAELEAELTDRIRRRNHVELRWLDDLRQFHGFYDHDTLRILNDDPDRSKIFVNYTRPKTTAWAARLGDMLFPNDDRNWGIKATPVPQLTDDAKAAVREAEAAEQQAAQAIDDHNGMVDQGVEPEQLVGKRQEAAGHLDRAQKLRAIEREAKSTKMEADRRSQRMQTEIDDQLTESRYPAVCRDVIDDACKLGIGVLKGPLTASKPRRRWMPKTAEDGTTIANTFVLANDNDPRPLYRRVNPWHFFPDPDALDITDSDSTFERHLLNKSAFRRWARQLGWHPETVKQILFDGPSRGGMGGEFANLTQLRMMSVKNEDGVINRFVVYEYHGPMECEQICTMLRTLGKVDEAEQFEKEEDPLDSHMVICYFCQGRLLKLEEYFPLDSGETLYSLFPFEKDEATIFGAVGIPHLMRHQQSMLNSAVRMMMDNSALSVGPQVVIDKTQVEPENGRWKLTPRKIWKKKGQDIGKDQAPFATYNIPMNQAQIAGIIELAIRFIDDVVSMPTIAQGEQGAHVTQTSSGMSMLFNSANVVFRRVVKNWDDDLTTPTIRRAFDWNMQFNPNDGIKGDMQAEARGTSVLLVREIQSQQLMLIAQNWSAHPVLGPAVEVYNVMRLTLQALNINPDDVLCDKDTFEQRIKAAAEASAGQESPEAIRAKTSLDVAKITAESRQAEAQVQKEIAELNQKTEILKLVQKDGVDMAQVQAMLASHKINTDSKERLFAAEAAIERQNAEDARRNGEQPKGSGGYISEGTVAA